MRLRMTSIPLMLDYVSGLAGHPGDRAAAERIFAHADYQFELRRYGLPSAEHLIDYFSRLILIAPEEIPDLSTDHRKNMLREKHGAWLDCAGNPERYARCARQLAAIFTDDFLRDMQRRLAAMFPRGTGMIPDPAVVSTLSFGSSFGYPFEGTVHLDLFGVERCRSMEELPIIVLHEMHHLQVQKLAEEENLLSGFGLLDRYIFQFAGEGLAVKFCNNAEGALSRRLDPGRDANLGLTAMSALNEHFPEHFRLFCDTVRRIREGAFTQADMVRQQQTYWMNPLLYGGAPLEQLPVYSLGNDLYGCVYDAFGLEETYACFRRPARLIDAFNRADCGWSIP